MIPGYLIAVLIAQVYGHYPTQPSLTQDSATGVYSLSYTGSDGIRHTVRFISDDSVAPQLTVDAITGQGPFHYSYRLGNGLAAKLSIAAFDLACEPASIASVPRIYMQVFDSIRAKLPGPQASYCRFDLLYDPTSPGISAGASLPLSIDSAWLPGIRTALARGVNEVLALPAGTARSARKRMTIYLHSTGPTGENHSRFRLCRRPIRPTNSLIPAAH